MITLVHKAGQIVAHNTELGQVKDQVTQQKYGVHNTDHDFGVKIYGKSPIKIGCT